MKNLFKKIPPLSYFFIILNIYVLILVNSNRAFGSRLNTYSYLLNIDMMMFWMIPGYMLLTPITVPIKSYFYGLFFHYLFEIALPKFWTIRKERWLCGALLLILLPFLFLDYRGVWHDRSEKRAYKKLVIDGRTKTRRVLYFGVHGNVVHGEPNTKYISLYYDDIHGRGVREETWPDEAPTYNKGDVIVILYDPDAKFFNQSSPNFSTLHNKKIQELLKKYRPELLSAAIPELSQTISAYKYRDAQKRGRRLQTKVVDFNEIKGLKERMVSITIEWPVQLEGVSIKPPELIEKWVSETPSYKSGDMIDVYYLEYPRIGSEQSFAIGSVNRIE